MPVPVYDEEEYEYEDDSQQAYARAPPPPPPPPPPPVYTSYAPKPSPRRAKSRLYEGEAETADDVDQPQQPRSASSSSSAAAQPRRLSQQQRAVSSSSTSFSRSVLSPTSVAAFDPLVSPDTRTTAARALSKRASLRQSADGSSAAASYDYFDAVDPSPPAYEQVLASDDVIAAQFSSQLSITPLQQDDVARFEFGVKTPKGSRPAPPQPPPSAVAAAAASARLRASPRRARPAVRRPAEEEQAEADEEAEAVVISRPVMRKATSQPVKRRPLGGAAVQEQQEDYRAEEKQLPRVQRRAPRVAAAVEQQEEEEEEQEEVMVVASTAAVAKPRQRVMSSQSAPSIRASAERQQAVRAGVRRTELKQREEELEDDQPDEEAQPPQPVRRVRQPAAQRPQQRPQRAVSREAEDKQDDDDDDDDKEADEPVAQRPPQRNVKAAAARPSTSLSSSPAPGSGLLPARPFRPARVKVDALAFMRAGTPFLKYTSSLFSSPPHFRQFQLLTSPVPSIVWFSSAKPLSSTSIPLSAISAVLLGQQTATFAKHKAVELAALSFSIAYVDTAGKERTLDLTAKDGNEMNIWVAGIDRMRRLGQKLDGRRTVLVDITVMYGGSPSQDIAEFGTGRVVDTRKRSQIEEEERLRRGGRGSAGGEELQGVGSASAVHSSLYRELQPRFQRLQTLLLKRKEDAKRAEVLSSPLHGSVQAMLKRVEAKCRVVSDALMDGQLELADQQLWLAGVELDGLDNVIASIK